MRILKPSPLHDDKGQAAEWLEFVQENPLPECVQFYDYDHIATMFDGTARVEKTEDEEEKPRRAKTEEPPFDTDEGPRRNRRSEPDEDDETDKAAVRRSRLKEGDDAEEVDAKPRRSRINGPSEVDESDEKPRGSIRDRLQRRSRIEETED